MPKESCSSAQVFYPRFTPAELVALLRERAPLWNAMLPLEQMWLFGSWAKGKATAFSDIDLLVIYAAPPRADAYV